MRRNDMKKKLAVALLALVVAALAAPVAYASLRTGNGTAARATTRAVGDAVCTSGAATTPTAALSDAEAAGLAFMREEEKLAHDVYVLFAEEYGLRAFTNIATSESRHTAAVKQLLDRYSIADPAASPSPGVFTDPALQDLYDELTAQGEVSLDAALRAAIAIEKADIVDLQERLAATTHGDVATVYENLLAASQNHLRAFERLLDRFGS
jgi:hypothetical protein